MKWKLPHISKVYEALGAIADGRVEVTGNTAKVYSSSRNKFYEVTYDPAKNSIMSNDNSAYWKGELGYPAIALLMQLGVLPYDKNIAGSLKGIAWKDINQKHKNDFDKTVEGVLQNLGQDADKVSELCDRVLAEIGRLDLAYLGSKQKPPAGY